MGSQSQTLSDFHFQCFFFLNSLFISGCAGSSVLHRLSLVVASKGTLHGSAQALIALASLVVEHGL